VAHRGLLQAAGSWSVDDCCAVHGNDCYNEDDTIDGSPCSGSGCDWCFDRASSSDWLFGLWPGPPQRFQPTGTHTAYQRVVADYWPQWGSNYDLDIDGGCSQGGTYRGRDGEICGGDGNWGATDVEVWYPR